MDQAIRPLSPMEYGLWFMDFAASTNFIHVAEISGELTHASLKAAVDYVQTLHPMLGVCIKVESKKQPVFCPIDLAAPVTSCDFEAENTSLSKILEEENRQRFDFEKGPLFRVKLGQWKNGQAIILTLHHAIGDGVCGAHLLDDLLAAADAIMRGVPPNLPSMDAPGPMEHRIDVEHKGISALSGALGSLIVQAGSKNILRRYSFPPLDAKAQPSKRKQRFVLRELDAQTTKALAAEARANKSSVHSALSAAQLIALAEEIPGKNAPRIPQLSLVDLRKRFLTRLDPRAMGVNISSVESVHTIERDTDFWDAANDVRDAIAHKMDKQEPFTYWPSLMRIMHLTRGMSKLDPAGADSSLRQGEIARPSASIISNIGPLSTKEKYSSFSINKFYFLMAVSGSGYFSCSANSFDGRLFLNFTHAHPTISRERAVRIADRTCALLSQAAR